MKCSVVSIETRRTQRSNAKHKSWRQVPGVQTPGVMVAGGFNGEMAQRILLEFDALDKYSRDVLAKHAKQRSLSYLQRIPSLRIPLSLDFETEIDQYPEERTSSRRTSTPRSSRYPLNADLGKTVHLRPFTASGYNIYQDFNREEREPKKLTKPRCVSADRRRSWRSEVQSIPDLDTLCHWEYTGPVLSSLGAPFTLSPREMVQDSSRAAEKSEEPPSGDDPGAEALLPGTAQSATDHRHPSRENRQKADTVSLCLEDELKKSNAKIISVRQKTIRGHIQNVSETHPIIYHNHIASLSDFQRSLSTRPYYFLSSQRPMGKSCSPGGPLLQDNKDSTDPLKNRQLGLQAAMIKKKKANKKSSSDNMKVILHYLSADGTKQRVEMAKDGNVAKQKQVNSSANKKTFLQDGKTIQTSQSKEKDEEHGVGPVINGLNPMTAMVPVPSLHARSHQTQRLFCPSSARTSSSSIPRPNSVQETNNWSYISISKPLSPPEGPTEPLQNKTSSPDLVKAMVMSTPEMRPTTFTTKSIILENRTGRPGSSSVELNPMGTHLASERSIEGYQEETKMEGGGFVESTVEKDHIRSPSTEMVEIINQEKESHEEQIQNTFPFPVQHNTIPVINIPTATTDSAE
ncbi:uncharacterized protein LOC130283387 [Hyla sarda]|uniref:uncharacterized protein LOC130283387 n=1 Tax=Hyla sarda TaxID=327740 RepID=UPI0024C2187E|nr:uncharacterized protein LOC130283387 [Hyla sarda]